MRWLAIVAAVLLAGAAALFGAGYFLLPSAMVVERSIEIGRPRAAVFALVSNLKTFNEWTPYENAEFVVEGQSGVGQNAAWASTAAAIGPGNETIVRLVENERVETVLDLGMRHTVKSTWLLRRSPAGARVDWTMVSDCSANPLYVPCRYVNLMRFAQIERDNEGALDRLKTLAEQLPPVDFEALEPQYVQAVARSYAYVENDVTRDVAPAEDSEDPAAAAAREAAYARRVRQAIDQSLVLVRTLLTEAGAEVRPEHVVVTVSADASRMVFRAGYPFEGAAPSADPRVATGTTPSGRAMKIVHTGPSQSMAATYRMIGANMQAHRIQEAGGPWEVYAPADANGARRTEIYVPLR
jgi:effector-binding domain-containing protein/ribosome-associated toxin RatA of RatAB toxin-antitoxin module